MGDGRQGRERSERILSDLPLRRENLSAFEGIRSRFFVVHPQGCARKSVNSRERDEC